MKDTKELLYEKIVIISDQKDKVIKENEKLQKQLQEANLKIADFEKREDIDFVGRLTKMLSGISVDEKGEIKVDEAMFGATKTPETLIAKYFVKAITEKARSMNLDPKKIAEEIIVRIK